MLIFFAFYFFVKRFIIDFAKMAYFIQSYSINEAFEKTLTLHIMVTVIKIMNIILYLLLLLYYYYSKDLILNLFLIEVYKKKMIINFITIAYFLNHYLSPILP